MSDINLLNFDSSVSSTLAQPAVTNTSSKTDAAKLQFAHDFESVFINKLLDEMKNTIGEWSGEKDGASQQIDGIFWTSLGNDLGEKGGFGMWKDIYNSLNKDTANTNATSESLDKQL